MKLLQSIRRRINVRTDFLKARRHLLSSMDLTVNDKYLLGRVALNVHSSDNMYQPGAALHYLSVGLSASCCIREAVRSTNREPAIRNVLDMPSGYGRVLRFLPALFPDADITAAEIDADALAYCRTTFSVDTLLSQADLSGLPHQKRYDLIWCGSLFTHIDEQSAINLLRFFFEHLTEGGLCVFTTHGIQSIEWIKNRKTNYGLSEDSLQTILQDYQTKGYGYVDYPKISGYGVSVVSNKKMREMANTVGDWTETLFTEHGWDNHQDVYALTLQRR